ncbi:MAG: hypothetical protein AB8E82_05995 [Aureispira sp.]
MTELEVIRKMNGIFASRGWRQKNKRLVDIVFNGFCDLLHNIDFLDGKELVLELTQRYLWISKGDYSEYLAKAFNQIESKKLKNIERIYVKSILKPDDVTKVKSGDSVLYDLKGEWFYRLLNQNFENITILPVKEITSEIERNIIQGDLFIMVDDFLGSGQTVFEAILDLPPLLQEKVNIIAIVGHQFCLERLLKKNIPHYVACKIKREISDHYTATKIKEKEQIMRVLEKSLPNESQHQFSFGFGDCQALVSMDRTPDNTFPIFWHQYVKNNKKYYPPFYRKTS